MDVWKLSLCQTNSFHGRTVFGGQGMQECRARVDVSIRVTPSYTADFFFFVFWDACIALVPVLELYKTPGWPQIYGDLPASTFLVLGLKARATTSRLFKCVAQAGFKLVILLPLPPSANPTGVCHHNWVYCWPNNSAITDGFRHAPIQTFSVSQRELEEHPR